MKKIFLIIISLFLITNAFADKCYNPVATPLILESDKKPGRFFEDQPDVNDDYQVHFFYVLAKDSKDEEIDVNGWLEKRLTTVNNKFEKWSKKNKKSNGVGQKFKFDYRKDGKIDITFVRMDLTKAGLPKYPELLIYGFLSQYNYFNNPKKTYAIFTGFNAKAGNSHGGSGSVPITTIFTPAVKSYGITDMDIIILHELFHTQGASYKCGKRTYDGAHVKGSDVLGSGGTTIDLNTPIRYLLNTISGIHVFLMTVQLLNLG